MISLIKQSHSKLLKYCEKAEFKGYDPYDILNSFIPFHLMGKIGQSLAIQLGKRIPFNFRPIIGIQKEINPKGIGILLQSYSLLYKIKPRIEIREIMGKLFELLKIYSTPGFSGYCWGYNFIWANPVKVLPKFYPSIVVTGFVVKGIYEYYLATKDKSALTIIKSASDYILNDLPVTENEHGICFSYTDILKDTCFNASLLGAEVLAMNYAISNKETYLEKAIKAIDFALAYQKEDGKWYYSINLNNNKEDKQVDFHQGFIIESIRSILSLTQYNDSKYTSAILKGAEFYYKEQTVIGKMLKYRWPKVYPIDIHNQAQAIITFANLYEQNKKYLDYSQEILVWTIDKMQNKRNGSFYYRRRKHIINKIPYIRWGQAWMLLAFATFLSKKKI